MKKILVLGAGRSASTLIRYLIENASKEDWEITVADISSELALQKTGNHPRSRVVVFDITDETSSTTEISSADLVISLLPPQLHIVAAAACIRHKKHLVTASYVSKEIEALSGDTQKAGIIFLNEMGLDPGIDHMSAMKIIDRIRAENGELVSFKSYCGGLIAPQSNDNPWGYKFTWNPRNVVLAGQGGAAQYIENGKYKYIPYNRLFLQTEKIKVNGCGTFEAYANRDSLSYRKPYHLDHIPTLLRGTLRMPGFCRSWNALIKLGWTDDNYILSGSGSLTWRELTEAFLPEGNGSLKKRVARLTGEKENSSVLKNLAWLGIFEKKKTGMQAGSPAQILQSLLEEKWRLKKNDVDMIVMQHVFEFNIQGSTIRNKKRKIISSLVVKGEDPVHTAMSKTVGLPLGIAAKLILSGKIKSRGVQIPVMREIYEPALIELEKFGICFSEEESEK